jgi:hypothetical protein
MGSVSLHSPICCRGKFSYWLEYFWAAAFGVKLIRKEGVHNISALGQGESHVVDDLEGQLLLS